MKRYLILFLLLCASVAQAQTIADKLTTINSIKLDIKAALASKSQTVGDDFSVYDDAVASITSDSVAEMFPESLADDAATATENFFSVLDTNKLAIMNTEYCGNGVVLACRRDHTGGAAILRSTDYGYTYTAATTTTDVVIYESVYCGSGTVIAPAGNNSTQRLYRSTNYGANWSSITLGASADTFLTACAYLGSSTVIVSTYESGQIHRSSDRGATAFTKEYESVGNPILCLESLGDGIALAGGSGAAEFLLKTEDYGDTWAEVTTEFDASSIACLEYCGNGVVLAGTNGNGRIYRSTDYGDTWTLASQTSETVVWTIAYCNDGVVYAGTETGGLILKSTDSGASWPSVAADTIGYQVKSITYIGDGVALYGLGGNGVDGDAIVGRLFKGIYEEDRWKR